MDRIIEKKKWPLRRIIKYAASLLFILITIYIAFFKFSESTLNVQTDRLMIATVDVEPFQEYISIIGNVRPIQTIYLDAVEGGRVEEIFTDGGVIVKKGQKLIRLENTNLLLDIMYREAQLFEQSNNLRNSRLLLEQNKLSLNRDITDAEYQLQRQKRIYERKLELYEDKLISKQDYEEAKDEYEYLKKKLELIIETRNKDLSFRDQQITQLESSLNRMQLNLDIVKKKLENLTVRAPIAGQLTSLSVEVGQLITMGQRFGQIDVLEGFKVRAEIDEHYIGRVELGKDGEFDLSDKTYRIIVKKIYPEVQDGKFNVDLSFEGKEPEGIKRGQTLHIRLELGEISDAMVLPRGGFYQTTGGNWVYVLDESGKVAFKRNIKLGRQNPNVYEILEGLKKGDRVIISSYDSFGDVEKLVLK